MAEIIEIPLPCALSGIHVVPCSIGCLYPPQAEAEDLLMVDFDQRSLHGDGLYLVEGLEDDQWGRWRGCRRFQREPGSWWMDISGEREWQEIGSVESIGLRVVGYVREVYKPTRRINEIIRRSNPNHLAAY